MDLPALVISIMFLVNLVNTHSVNEMHNDSPAPQTEPTTIKTTTINPTYVCKNLLDQILVEFCASEIDRNKTASAVSKFGRLNDPESSIKKIVNFYTENYQESFDNLLPFVGQISSLELRNLAYITLIEAIQLNKIHLTDALSFESFLRTKFEATGNDDIEKKTFDNLLLAVGNEINELIVATDLNIVITAINSTNNPARIFEVIPKIVQGIDLTNFSDMDRIFQFSMQLPKVNQLSLISEVLSRMRERAQYQHLFHVILQIRMLRQSLSYSENRLLLTIENEIPAEWNQLFSVESRWQIRYVGLGDSSNEYLVFKNSPRYSKNLLLLSSTEPSYDWQLQYPSSNSAAVVAFNEGEFLSIEYCFHNESFPSTKKFDDDDPSQTKWYLLMGNELNYFQIKNIYTNELLVVDHVKELGSDKNSHSRLAFSANCLDCDASKWWLKSANYEPPPDYIDSDEDNAPLQPDVYGVYD